MMKIFRVLILLLLAVSLLFALCTSVDASNVDFGINYNKTLKMFTVTGTASPHSRVLLLVYTPFYGDEDDDGVYYFEAIDDVDTSGMYTFTIKMHTGKCRNGIYTFQVGVNGNVSGTAEKTYNWLDSEMTNADFTLAYDNFNMQFKINGNSEIPSRVMLIVYSPRYDEQTMNGIFHFDSVDSKDGNYKFVVKMDPKTCENGVYTFQIGINGDTDGSVKKQYEWNESNSSSAGFVLKYDEADNAFIVKGDAEAASRVMLIVYSPNYSQEDMTGIYYMESLYTSTGEFIFYVKMKQGIGIGRYRFQVGVNGEDVGSCEHEYIWPDYNDKYDVEKFVLDGKLKSGSTVNAVAVLGKDDSLPTPYVMIALYEKHSNILKTVATKNILVASVLENQISASISNLPSNINDYYIKAYLFTDNASIQPITTVISLGVD